MNQKTDRTKIFFDTEFTGLHQKTTLISIGIVAETMETFYCELDDYDRDQLNPWLIENVIDNLKHKKIEYIAGDPPPDEQSFAYYSDNTDKYPYSRNDHANHSVDSRDGFSIDMMGTMEMLKNELTKWLLQFGEVEIWSDTLAYDWVLFNEIYGHAFNITVRANTA